MFVAYYYKPQVCLFSQARSWQGVAAKIPFHSLNRVQRYVYEGQCPRFIRTGCVGCCVGWSLGIVCPGR
jgi:hypothetical protein